MTRKQYIVGFILLIGAIFGILAYYFSLDGRFSDIKDNIKDIINNISFNKNEKSDNSINLKADVNFDLNSSIDNFEISFSGSDLGILSMDNGLKQRLSANNLSFILKDGFGEEKVEISNLDLISNEESVYYKFGESEFLEEIFGNTNNNDDYTKIDNSKFIIQMIGDLANNDLIVGLIKGLVSSNPNAYFEKYGIDEELLNLFFSKGSYKLLFEEFDNEGDKKYLSIKEDNCDIFVDLYNSSKDEYTELQFIEFNSSICKEYISNANKFVQKQLYVTNEGDIETLHYDGFFIFDLSYQNGEILSYNLKSPMIGLNSEYQNNKLSFKFSPTFLQMAGENLEFNANLNFEDEVFGNIKFNYESENSGGNANLNIDIKDDKIINYNTVGNLENLYEKITWEGEGNQDSGSFELVSKFQNEIVGNILYKYDDNKYDLNFDTEEVKIIGKLEKENEMYNFDLNFQLNNGNEFDISSKIKFIDNKIDYFSLDLITNIPIKFTGLDIISNNKYKILYENNYLDSTFNYYEINSGEEKHILSSSLSGDLSYNNTDLNLSIEPIEEIGDSFIKGNLNHNNDYLKISGNLKEYDDLYYLDIEGDFSAWENIDLQGSAGTENTDKEEIINLDKMFSYKDNEIKSKFNINSMGEEMFSYNLNINYEIDNFEHIIPSNYVQAKDNEFLQLPNFSSYNDIETPYLIAGGIVGLGMFLSTSVPDRTYAQAQSRDAARFANIGQIGTALSIYHYDRGIYPESDGIIEVSEIQDYLIPRYMDSLPNDPLDGKNYYYISLNSDGEENKGYALIAELESNDGNISANSIDEVYNMIKGVNYDSKNLKEILQDFGNYYLMVK